MTFEEQKDNMVTVFLVLLLIFTTTMAFIQGCSDKTTIVESSYCVGNCVPCKPLVKCKILVDSLRLELKNCEN